MTSPERVSPVCRMCRLSRSQQHPGLQPRAEQLSFCVSSPQGQRVHGGLRHQLAHTPRPQRLSCGAGRMPHLGRQRDKHRKHRRRRRLSLLPRLRRRRCARSPLRRRCSTPVLLLLVPDRRLRTRAVTGARCSRLEVGTVGRAPGRRCYSLAEQRRHAGVRNARRLGAAHPSCALMLQEVPGCENGHRTHTSRTVS